MRYKARILQGNQFDVWMALGWEGEEGEGERKAGVVYLMST